MRQAQQAAAAQNGAPEPQGDGTPTSYAGARPVTLPPIGYQAQQYPPGANVPQQTLPEYHGNMYQNYPPHSPYGQPGPNMYNQRKQQHGFCDLDMELNCSRKWQPASAGPLVVPTAPCTKCCT